MTFKLALIVLMNLTPKMHAVPFQSHDVECLAKNIYYEAPDETYEGKLAVATVTLNRVQHKEFPKTVCGVVYQRGQFSWTRKPYPIKEKKTYQEAQKIAMDVLFRNKRLISIKNSLYFHNTSVTPKWSFVMTPIQRIGSHIFYVTRRT